MGTMKELGDFRYEIKMVLDEPLVEFAESWVTSNSFGFSPSYPPRRVNNIYFDTYDRDFLNAHLNGEANRIKIRLRWYGKTWVLDNAQLEIKKKSGNLGEKIIFPMHSKLDISKTEWHEVYDLVQNETPEGFQNTLSFCEPIILNYYQRQYFVSANGAINLTIDNNMRVYDQSTSQFPNLETLQILRDQIIIEFKSSPDNYSKLADILAEFPLCCSQFSKYLTGCEKLI